ncbi:putative ribonuclease H-like domain-containing protein [Tanacetum coccineum]
MANLEFCDTHNMVAYLKKPEGSEEFHQIVDFLNSSHIRYALTENPTIYVSLIKQFWETATARTLDTGEVELTATIDGKVKIVTGASVRRHLQLAYSDGISSLPNTEIFEQLSLMGSASSSSSTSSSSSVSLSSSILYFFEDSYCCSFPALFLLIIFFQLPLAFSLSLSAFLNFLDDFVDVNESVSESVVEKPTVETNEPKTARKENGAPIIEDWVSDSDEENVPKVKTVEMFNKPSFAKINFVKSTEQVKSPRKTSVDKNRQNTPSPRGNKRNWNQQMSQKLGSDFEMFNKACHVCGSFDHLKNDCNNWYNNGRFAKPVWTNVQRVNKQNFSKLTHPNPKRNMVPRTVLTRSGPISLNTARPVNTVQPRTVVNNAGPMKNVINNAYSTARRPFNKITVANNSNFTKKVNTVKGTRVNTARPKAVLSVVKGNKGNAVKASACWVWRPKHKVLDHVSKNNGASMSFKRFDYIDAQGIQAVKAWGPQKNIIFLSISARNTTQDLKNKGVIDSGCSRHMTGNISYLTDYEEIDGGFVAFGGNSKGGKITRKGKIRTSKLDFKDVYFVKELKFNLFSVSQMCDKKNSVLFTDTECVVLSPDFKLTDESHVLLKVPRKDNMYSVDLKNVVPQGGLTCLFAKATPDESNLWHRRLGHVNFKTMNKLVKGNLVRGLPSKLFEINQTRVACQKGKQHRASCKTKTVIIQPLQMLHMDLFGLTFVKSLMKKMYCLVVTDDFSRFSWVFFLATKDETSEILKTFITGIENLIDLRVKVIRCDNGTEFKNRVMNQFCEMKGIKREFSVSRTSQQNGVVERKNRTLIEVARTMLADSKLPTTFWVEAVNTACYVQNRVLVIKPHNKTPYELSLGRKPALSFMRPFRCPITILNTIDHLGSGPNWLFDIDTLTNSMNYKPVVAGNQSNGNAGTKACNDAGKAIMETTPSKDYILLPMWPADLIFSQNSKESPDAGFKPSEEEEKKDAEDPGNESGNPNEGKDKVNVVDPKTRIELPNDPNMPELEDIVYSDNDEDMDVKSALLYGKIEEEVYVFQPPGFEDPDFLDRVYKVEKALYGLHQAPRAWYETLSTYLLENGF